MFGRRKNEPRAPRGPLDRLAGRAYQDDGGRTAYSVLLGVLSFLLVASVATWQVTSPSTGRRLLENGIVALTDVDVALREQEQALRDAAARGGQPAYTLPGYPLDVYFTAAEIQQSSTIQLRAMLLDRSSAIVYGQGLGAFDRTGDQSISFLSSEGALKRFVGLINEENHDRARLASVAAAVAVALVAAMLASRNEGYGRVRALGVPLFIGGLVGVGLTLGVGLLVDRWWRNDPFDDDVNALFHDVLGIATRDFGVVAGLGVFLFVLGVGFGFIGRRFESAPSSYVDDDFYDPAYDEELEAS